MPRPSLKDVRSLEILDAFMRCVARFGLDGSTLARIADDAGIGRPLLRHYLGNREQMVERLLEHVMMRFDEATESLFENLNKEQRLQDLLDRMFGKTAHTPENAAVFQALVAASHRHAGISRALMRFVSEFERRIVQEISLANPDTADGDAKVAAAGVTAIYFNSDAIAPLSPSNDWRNRQKAAAQRLLFSEL